MHDTCKSVEASLWTLTNYDGYPDHGGESTTVGKPFIIPWGRCQLYWFHCLPRNNKWLPLGIEQHENEILITVADRGPGIPKADLERVFDKFYRVQRDKRKSNYPTGSGLGLAICKGIVEAHGGRIWAQARDGGEVIFSVTLPIN